MAEAHGALRPQELAALGIDPAQVLDFSSNCLVQAPASVLAAARAAPLESYPDPDCSALRARISALWGQDSVVVGNGAAALLWACVSAYSREGELVLCHRHSFGEYANAALTQRRRVYCVQQAIAERSLEPMYEALQRRPALVFICQPNNPSGRLWPEQPLRELIAQARRQGSTVVVDHAYRVFACPQQRFAHYDGAINVYSMTKDFAVAGLRLGFALGDTDLGRFLPPWSASSAAQAAGVAALSDTVLGALEQRILIAKAQQAQLWQSLRANGHDCLDSDTHFGLIRVGDADGLRARLLREHAIQVRSARSFGLPDYIRVCTRAGDDARLVAALGRRET